jgi:glycerol-3-phosphate O-acyltransferase
LRWFDQAIAQALDRFARDRRIEASEASGQRVWSIVPEQRITLEFYKNQVLHVFAPAALAAAAIRGLDDDAGFGLEQARPGFSSLVWLVRREFVFDPDRSVTSLLSDGFDALAAHGAIQRAGERYEVVDAERMGEIYGLVRPLLESYLLCARSDGVLARGGIGAKELPPALQAEGEGLLSGGAITRPEALSLVNLQNAIASLQEDGVLVERGGALALSPERRAAMVAWLQPMVD